jgi:hypothetical protein
MGASACSGFPRAAHLSFHERRELRAGDTFQKNLTCFQKENPSDLPTAFPSFRSAWLLKRFGLESDTLVDDPTQR